MTLHTCLSLLSFLPFIFKQSKLLGIEERTFQS